MTIQVRDKILIITAATIFLAIGVNTLIISRMFRKEYSASLLSEMDVIANTLRSQMERLLSLGIDIDNIDGFEIQCMEVLHKHNEVACAMVVQSNGKILFHNDTSHHGTVVGDPEILKGIGARRQITCLSKIHGHSYYHIIVPVGDVKTGPNIAVVVGFPTSMIDKKIGSMRFYSFIVLFISLGIGTFILLMSLSVSVTKPLSSLVSTIQQIRESSDLNRKVTVKSKDEIGKLAVNFNKMIEDLNRTTVSRDSLIAEVKERKRAEEELTKLLSLHTATLEATAAGILVVGLDGQVIAFNKKFLQLCHLPENITEAGDNKGLLTRAIKQVVDPDGFMVKVQWLFAHPQEQSCDIIEFKDGRIFERFSQPQKVGDEIVGRVLSFRDITERRITEEELRKTEEKYRRQFEGALDAIFIVDIRTCLLVDCNPAGTRLVKRNKSELIGKSHKILYPANGMGITLCNALEQNLEDNQDQTIETQVITKTGEIKDVAVKANLLEIGGKKVFQGVFRDVTERKKADEALRESEALLNEVGTIARIGGWEMDLITRKAKWTKGTYDIVEIDYDNIVPGPDEHIKYYLPEYRPLVEQAMRKLIEDDEPLDIEAQFRTAKGNIKWCRAAGRSVRESGKCIKVYGTFQDITDRKLVEEALEQVNISLEQALERLTASNSELVNFVHVAAHDLKSPLRTIGCLAGIVAKDYGDKIDTEGKEYIDLIVARAECMSERIDKILRYSEIGRVETTSQKVDLNVVLQNVIQDIAHSEGLEIVVENELPVVISQEDRISEIFYHLINNSVQHMDKPQGRITIGCVEEGNFWKFSIADNGQGIEKKYHEKIFEIFQTLSSGCEFRSTGIGLSMVKKIVEIFGGNVWLESDVGVGTTFYFTLQKQKMGDLDNEKLETDNAC